MKKVWMMGLVVLMSVVFAGVALAGNEEGNNTYYGESAGNNGGGAYNSSLGYKAGFSLTTDGERNTFMGSFAGQSNTTASNNTFIGSSAGLYNTTGYQNTFIGSSTGLNNGTGHHNNFMGNLVGYYNTTGSYNNFIGHHAGFRNNVGQYNNFMGAYAGDSNTSGAFNNFIGASAGSYNTTGHSNTFLGHYAGVNVADENGNTTENFNTLIGTLTNIDYNQTAGTINNATAIGYKSFVAQADSLVLGSIAGVNDATASVNVGIGTSVPARQLHVVGDQAVFRMDRPYDTAAFMLVRTDGSGNPLKTFVVGANASGSNTGEFVINDLGTAVSGAGTTRLRIANNGVVYVQSLVQTSSIVHKTNVKTYENALETVTRLRGVKFDWKDSKTPSVGLIAEEVEEVVPEVVSHNGKDSSGVNYSALVGVLVEAVKEQDVKLKEQQKSISALSQKVSELERLLILSNAVSKVD